MIYAMEASIFGRGIPIVYILLCFISGIRVTGQTSETKPEITSLHIQSDIKFRFATTQVTSRVTNPHQNATEAVFDVTLPNEAFITNFTMEIDGVLYPGKVKERKEAKRQFERAKSQGQSAGHISVRPRETNKFVIEVNIAPKSKVNFYLTYQELLKRKLGFYEHEIYINPGQVVEDLKVDVVIQESREITRLRVPPLRNDISHLKNIGVSGVNSVAEVTQPTRKSAYIKYYPTVDDQKARSDQGNLGKFIVKYDVERNTDAGDVLVVDGYFVHFLAPEGLDPIPKDIMFVLDISGSMAGTKLSQLKSAMQIILDDLQEGDRFNILVFHTTTKLWKQEGLVSVNAKTVTEAKDYVNGLRDLRSTNINAALVEGVEFLQTNAGKGERSPILVFLTDGQPTTGETNSDRILSNLRKANRNTVPVFSMAFGHDADFDLVKEVSAMNNGMARKIYEDADAALQMTDFFDAISTTLLKNIRFTYLDENVDIDSLTKHRFNNYFDGSEMVVAGKLSNPDVKMLNIAIDSKAVTGDLKLTVNAGAENTSLSAFTNLLKLADLKLITERVWSYLTIKQLLENNAEKNVTAIDVNKQRALNISLKYNFVTPLTSMVVTKPSTSEDQVTVHENETPDIPHKPLPRRIPHKPLPRRPSGIGWSRPRSRSRMSRFRGRSNLVPSVFGFTGRGRSSHGIMSAFGGASSLGSGFGGPSQAIGMNGFGGGPSRARSFPSMGKSLSRSSPVHAPAPPTMMPSTSQAPSADTGLDLSLSTNDPAFVLTFEGVTTPLCFRSLPSFQTGSTGNLVDLYLKNGLDIAAKVTRRPGENAGLQEIKIKVNSSTLIFTPHSTTLDMKHISISENSRTVFDGNVLETIADANATVYKLTLTAGTEILIIRQQSDTGMEYMSLYLRNAGGTNTAGIIGTMLQYQVALRETGNLARIELYSTAGKRDRARATRWKISPELASHLNIQSCWLVSQRYMEKFSSTS